MDTAQLNGLANFIWNIADDVLRDVFAAVNTAMSSCP
jgi:type I restriction-modification system DNA methylase subunit